MNESLEIKLEVEEKVKKCVDKLNEVFNFNMEYPEIFYDVTGTLGGVAKSLSMSVHYNYKMLINNRTEFIRDIVPHEVAHVAVYHKYNLLKMKYPKGHGANWQHMMRLLDVDPKQFHKLNEEEKTEIKYLYECLCPKGFLLDKKSNALHKKQIETGQYGCAICFAPLKNPKIHYG
jgi:SprT protein